MSSSAQDTILVLDFGGQYCHLIARRLRECGVAAEIALAETPAEAIQKRPDIKGLVLSGGARSVFDKTSPRADARIFTLGLPVLGICYGHQALAHALGGKVKTGKAGEYGLTKLTVKNPAKSALLKGVPTRITVWMNHHDIVASPPPGFVKRACTAASPIAAFEHPAKKFYGVQFHPEVTHTQEGGRILKNFALGICKCTPQKHKVSLADRLVAQAKKIIGKEKVAIGLSGGVDSSVAAAILSKAVGKQLTAVYVDTGLMRHNETAFIKKMFAKKAMKLRVIYAADMFFAALKGVTNPESKRKIIGKLFADIFTKEAKATGATFLAQGTIYSDRIESGTTTHAAVIKSHHNVGGLPKNLGLKLYEPLKEFYKDEVRALAVSLRLPAELATRQVFPGPGLAVRVIGEVTPERVAIVRKAGYIIEQELKPTKYWPQIWMSFAVLLPIRSVGIQGDERTYKYPLVMRVIESRDAMTANFSHLPGALLEKIATRITNEISDVNRVVYDITNKPPATMEWE